MYAPGGSGLSYVSEPRFLKKSCRRLKSLQFIFPLGSLNGGPGPRATGGRAPRVLLYDLGHVSTLVPVAVEIARRLEEGHHESDGQLRIAADELAAVVDGGDLHAVDEVVAQAHDLAAVLGQSGQRRAARAPPR